jgi:hypothetical protein
MQINPVLLDKTKTVDYLTHVLNRIEPMFGFNLSSICERHGNCLQDVSQEVLAVFSIRELKSLADSLVVWFETSFLPKRNSKISLSRWIAEIFLYIQQAIHEPIGASLSAAVNEASSDTLTEASGVEVEVLEPEEKPGYKISMHTDRLSGNTSARTAWSFTEEWVSCLPPYLVDRQGNLFHKTWSPSCHAHYSQLVCKNLSNIAAVVGGTKIKLMTDDLVVSEASIHGEPPPFIIWGAGVYKRMPRLACESPPPPLQYAQLVAENLSNIVLVGRQASCE